MYFDSKYKTYSIPFEVKVSYWAPLINLDELNNTFEQ